MPRKLDAQPPLPQPAAPAPRVWINPDVAALVAAFFYDRSRA
jgi:hypothetical protein